jgi:hypothetical protein
MPNNCDTWIVSIVQYVTASYGIVQYQNTTNLDTLFGSVHKDIVPYRIQISRSYRISHKK